MTPDELIEKHKKRINEFLPEEDREIIDAYVSMRIQQETKKIRFLAKCTDYLGLVAMSVLGASVIISLVSLIVFGFVRDERCRDYQVEKDEALQKVKNECYALKQESDEKVSESQTLFQACQDEQAKLQKVCIENLLKTFE